jgi:hypothetical protein
MDDPTAFADAQGPAPPAVAADGQLDEQLRQIVPDLTPGETRVDLENR